MNHICSKIITLSLALGVAYCYVLLGRSRVSGSGRQGFVDGFVQSFEGQLGQELAVFLLEVETSQSQGLHYAG